MGTSRSQCKKVPAPAPVILSAAEQKCLDDSNEKVKKFIMEEAVMAVLKKRASNGGKKQYSDLSTVIATYSASYPYVTRGALVYQLSIFNKKKILLVIQLMVQVMLLYKYL